MAIIDVIMLLALAGFVFYGMFFGLIRTLGAFLGVLIGAFLASHFYLPVSGWIDKAFFGYHNLGKVLVFLILFGLINRLVSFLFYLLDRAFGLITIIPFLKTFNRLGGIILGFLTGSLFLGIILYVISKYAILESLAGRWLVDSEFAPFFLKFAHAALPIFPEVMRKLESLI
jgi:uncharacterized membrane protein required for colicin V production